jgi:hypothetical protein
MPTGELNQRMEYKNFLFPTHWPGSWSSISQTSGQLTPSISGHYVSAVTYHLRIRSAGVNGVGTQEGKKSGGRGVYKCRLAELKRKQPGRSPGQTRNHLIGCKARHPNTDIVLFNDNITVLLKKFQDFL